MNRQKRILIMRCVLFFMAVAVLCLHHHLKHIPLRLESSCRGTLQDFGVRRYGILADGRDVYIHGIVPDADRIDSLKSRLSGIPGIRRLTLQFGVGIDSVKIERIGRLSGRYVLFGLDSTVPHFISDGLLDSAASVLKAYPGIHLILRGWTDKRGDPAYNRRLGERRAGAIRDALILRGCDPERLSILGLGEEWPDPGIRTDSLARRVDFVFEERLP